MRPVSMVKREVVRKKRVYNEKQRLEKNRFNRECYRRNPEKKLQADRNWNIKNPGKHSQLSLDWQKRNPKRFKAIMQRAKIKSPHTVRQYRYGISQKQFELMKKSQNNKCAICLNTFVETPNIDHNHKCCPGVKTCGKCLRKLLCRRCNRALGLIHDDLNIARQMVKYLEFYERKAKVRS